MRKIKVLIIEDSAVTRQVLTQIIHADAELDVVDVAIDPLIAIKKIDKHQPDVITLDLELPRMDGLTFLKKLMLYRPCPVVIISGSSSKGSMNAIRALEHGAVEVIAKPDVSSPEKLKEVSVSINEAIKAAYLVKMPSLTQVAVRPLVKESGFRSTRTAQNSSTSVVAVGASTGGTEALRVILQDMQPDCPGMLIVQHMPEMFTRSFAERLNAICAVEVKEAEDNDEVVDGRALIAPGNKHMILVRQGAKFVVKILQTEKVNRHRPSVDVLFKSVAQVAGRNSLGVLLTGMGDDGAAGLCDIRNIGGFTIAQDKDSSIVFGMPRRAIEMGGATEILPVSEIAGFLNRKSDFKQKNNIA